MGVFVLVAGICLSTAASFGQFESTSKSGAQSSSLRAETGTKQTTQAAKQPPSCTELSTQSNTQPLHTVTLSWKASTSPGVVGYDVYRRDKTSPTFGKINQNPIATTNCVDNFVQLGHTYYYYVVTANRPGVQESVGSNTATARIPPR
jgi:fibronectin type 3 domain-containing protein